MNTHHMQILATECWLRESLQESRAANAAAIAVLVLVAIVWVIA